MEDLGEKFFKPLGHTAVVEGKTNLNISSRPSSCSPLLLFIVSLELQPPALVVGRGLEVGRVLLAVEALHVVALELFLTSAMKVINSQTKLKASLSLQTLRTAEEQLPNNQSY